MQVLLDGSRRIVYIDDLAGGLAGLDLAKKQAIIVDRRTDLAVATITPRPKMYMVLLDGSRRIITRDKLVETLGVLGPSALSAVVVEPDTFASVAVVSPVKAKAPAKVPAKAAPPAKPAPVLPEPEAVLMVAPPATLDAIPLTIPTAAGTLTIRPEPTPPSRPAAARPSPGPEPDRPMTGPERLRQASASREKLPTLSRAEGEILQMIWEDNPNLFPIDIAEIFYKQTMRKITPAAAMMFSPETLAKKRGE